MHNLNISFTKKEEQISCNNAIEGKNVGAADIAWVLMSTALVMLMTPALAFFYGGLVEERTLSRRSFNASSFLQWSV